MRVFRVILPVDDIHRAARFYGAVFGCEGAAASRGRLYFQLENVVVVCLDAEADGDGRPSRAGSEPLYLSVQDVEATREAWNAAGGAYPDPIDPVSGVIEVRPWGERSFYGTDPFQNTLCFVQRGTEFVGG